MTGFHSTDPGLNAAPATANAAGYWHGWKWRFRGEIMIGALALVLVLGPGQLARLSEAADAFSPALPLTADMIFGMPRLTLGSTITYGSAALRGLAAGDFDRDGAPDLALAAGNELKVMMGAGNGTFRPGFKAVLAPQPGQVATGDFNGDGNLDVVVGTFTEVAVFLGNGTGSFRGPITTWVGSSVYGFTLGDFNRDGKLDLVAAQSQPRSLVLLAGRGDGTFEAPILFGSANAPGLVEAGDLNGDGLLDLVVVEASGVSVLLGNGDGSFAAAVFTPSDGRLSSMALGDFNRDGRADLAVGNLDLWAVSILLSRGDGTFQEGGREVLRERPRFLAVRDTQGKGQLAVLAAIDFGQVVVLESAGDGSFAGSATYQVGSGPRAFDLADFNQDSIPDLAIANAFSNGVSLLLGKGDGSFLAASCYDGSPDPYALVAGDFNRDGNLDLAIANRDGGPFLPDHGTVSILLGRGDGNFQPGGTFRTGLLPIAIAAGDLNGDGQLDLVTANLVREATLGVPPIGSTSVLLGRGDGTFEAPLDYSGGSQPQALALGDFNADGKLDVAVGAAGSQAVVILLGRGDGRLGSGVAYVAGRRLLSLAVADFDQDGTLDLATGSDSGVMLLLGRGDGTFSTGPQPTTLPGKVTAGDFNGDGKPDLLVAWERLWIFLGKGDGTFEPGMDRGPVEYEGNHGGIAVADVNGDGVEDLVVIADGIGVRLGTGEADFKPRVVFDAHTTYTTAGLALADFNQDGKADLAVANPRHVTVRLNTAPPAELELVLRHRAGRLNFSWSALFPGAVLESTPHFKAAQWEALPEIPVLQHGRWRAEIPAPPEMRFFRLRRL